MLCHHRRILLDVPNCRPFNVAPGLNNDHLPFIVIIRTVLSTGLQGKGVFGHLFVKDVQFVMVYDVFQDYKTVPMQSSNSQFEILPCQLTVRDLLW
jgi:hypothetical protein